MIKVHIFHTGSVCVDDAIPHGSNNPFAVLGLFRKKEHRKTLPVSCYLIEHPKGRVLIDTGWDSIYATQKPKRFFGLLDHISTPIIKQEESIDHKLSTLGFHSSDIDYVFLSHLDFDHTSGLRLVKDAKNFFASEEEIKDSKKYFFRYVKQNWDFLNLQPFHYKPSKLGPVGKSYDVFGDGTLLLVNTPGHSHGLFTAIISNGERFIALPGDTIYTQKSLKEHLIPGFTVHKKSAKKSLEWINSLSQDPNCIGIFANHDPEVTEQIIEL